MKWKAGLGKNVAIIGLGGLDHIGVKIAHALGAEVTVFIHLKNRKMPRKWELITFIPHLIPNF
jgi:D-arabinose 1-dehydrogenase-like Zn-dependent alcohol dehydrogenase